MIKARPSFTPGRAFCISVFSASEAQTTAPTLGAPPAISSAVRGFASTEKTFISKSIEYQRDVVPIHFGGQNSERFYRIARFSDKHLPFNLAMLFLVDEMYKNVGKHFRIAIGKPIPWQTFDKSKSATEWAQYVEDKVYEL